MRPSVGFGFGYNPFYSPFGYYSYNSPYRYNSYRRESKLDMKVNDIKADYSDKIKSAKHNHSISKDERKKIVKQLKADRDRDVHELKSNYYKHKTTSDTPDTRNNGS